jgi:hypothetical protein
MIYKSVTHKFIRDVTHPGAARVADKDKGELRVEQKKQNSR